MIFLMVSGLKQNLRPRRSRRADIVDPALRIAKRLQKKEKRYGCFAGSGF
jgi:hypothetical protein